MHHLFPFKFGAILGSWDVIVWMAVNADVSGGITYSLHGTCCKKGLHKSVGHLIVKLKKNVSDTENLVKCDFHVKPVEPFSDPISTLDEIVAFSCQRWEGLKWSDHTNGKSPEGEHPKILIVKQKVQKKISRNRMKNISTLQSKGRSKPSSFGCFQK